MDKITPIYNATSTAVSAAYYVGKTMFDTIPGIISSLTGSTTIPTYFNLVLGFIVVFILYFVTKKLLQILWGVAKNFVALCKTFIIVFIICHVCGYCCNSFDCITSYF